MLGDAIPASMKFTLGAAQDIMPAIELQTSGALKDSMNASWRTVTNARAYYLHAMGQLGNDMVMWSSSETADTGMGLFDYLPNATIDRWLKERVLLQPDTTQCAIPKGIFTAPDGRASEGAMLRMMAYGGESNFAHPPRPADPRATWEPEWAVRVRMKSGTMAMLGEEQGGGRSAERSGRSGRSGREQAMPEQRDLVRKSGPGRGRIGAAAAEPGRPAQGPVRPLIARPGNNKKARHAGPFFMGASAQIEKILPGFMMFFGSSARLIVRIMSTAPAPVSVTRNSILCRPTPCSPVQVPSRLSARITSW